MHSFLSSVINQRALDFKDLELYRKTIIFKIKEAHYVKKTLPSTRLELARAETVLKFFDTLAN